MFIDDDLKTFIRSSSFACLNLVVDVGDGDESLLVVKGSVELIEVMKSSPGTPSIEWTVHNSGFGPAVCLRLNFGTDGDSGFVAEVFLDLLDEKDEKFISLLSSADKVRVAFFGESLDAPFIATIDWGQVEQLWAEQTLDRGRALIEDTDDYDFEKAVAGYLDSHKLD